MSRQGCYRLVGAARSLFAHELVERVWPKFQEYPYIFGRGLLSGKGRVAMDARITSFRDGRSWPWNVR